MANLPRVFGKYEIRDEIARGGFATVYRSLDADLNRDVALKVLAPHLTWEASFTVRFQQEAQVAARLKHPNIVTIYEIGDMDGALFIAMELAQAGSLRDRLTDVGELGVGETIRILEPVAAALDFAHANGIVHRDVKPANILLDLDENGDARPILTDFGLVKALSNTAELTQSGTILGTVEYMAPEQADTDLASEIGPAADIYALGIVAYHMLTGQVPFSDSSAARVLIAHLTKEPPPPNSIRSDLPSGVSDAILRALAKEPEDRYPSATSFVDAMRAADQPGEQNARISVLYDQAQLQVNEEAWVETLDTISSIRQLDPDFNDPLNFSALSEKALRRSKQKTRLLTSFAALSAGLTNTLGTISGVGVRGWLASPTHKALNAFSGTAGQIASLWSWRYLITILLIIVLIGTGYVVASKFDQISDALSGILPFAPKAGGNVLFSSNRDGKREVYHLNSKGETTRMTNTPGNGGSWAPILTAGGSIYFTSNHDGKQEIYRLDSLGKTLRMTHTPRKGESWSPSSSAGGMIYFTSNRDGKQEIYRLNSLGKTIRMTHTPGSSESWSPSSAAGGSIYFTSNRHGKREIYRLDNLGKTIRMTNTPGSSESWSPSSSTSGVVYFTSNRDGKQEIYRLDSLGEIVRITNSRISNQSWSPSAAAGGALYFTSDRDGKREVYRLNSSGESIRMTSTPNRSESWTAP